MENKDVNFETLLEDLGGCGLFQSLVVIALSCVAIVVSSATYFMAYGLYNPGWKCLDNLTEFVNSSTGITDVNNTFEYYTGLCKDFDSCENVEFNPEVSTIVTEWGLICGKSLIPRLMISMKTIGTMVTSPIAGFIADKYGRKRTMQVVVFLQIIIHVVTIFSNSWQMFMIASVLIGMTTHSISLSRVVMTEFVVPNKRIWVVSFPMWCVATTGIALVAMLTKSWRSLRIYISALAIIAFLLLFWIPKSMRWLSLKGKDQEIKDVVGKIAKYNRTEIPQDEFIKKLVENDLNLKNQSSSYKELLTLFKTGYGIQTLVISATLFTEELVYFAIAYGVSALPGNVFENMIILTLSELPANLLAVYFGNSIGRKKSLFIFLLIETLILFGVSAFDGFGKGDLKIYGILVLVILAKLFLNVIYFVFLTSSLEIYPTAIRTTLIGVLSVVAAIGQLISPFVIPYDPDSLYINYLAMGGLTIICSFLACLLPETKGKKLENTFSKKTLHAQHETTGPHHDAEVTFLNGAVVT